MIAVSSLSGRYLLLLVAQAGMLEMLACDDTQQVAAGQMSAFYLHVSTQHHVTIEQTSYGVMHQILFFLFFSSES